MFEKDTFSYLILQYYPSYFKISVELFFSQNKPIFLFLFHISIYLNSYKFVLMPVCYPLNSLNICFLSFRVFTTVVSGLGEFFSPGREAKITTTYISEVIERRSKSQCKTISKKKYSTISK